MNIEKLKSQVFNINSLSDFNELALKIFYLQFENNKIYRKFINLLGIDISKINYFKEIPCLPIEFFKTHLVTSVPFHPEIVFLSSGTTDSMRSKSFVFSKSLYEQSIFNTFTTFYENPNKYIIAALIPDINTAKNSSLSYMLDFLIKKSENKLSGFYLNSEEELINIIEKNPIKKKILFGLTYTLLKFVEDSSISDRNLVVIETGGMKGKMVEITRRDLYKRLAKKLNSPIHSEYSMAEIMSQAYSVKDGVFKTPWWMQILIRDIYDPLSRLGNNKSGGIDIIDLANFYTCSFISTKDIGLLHDDLSFEVFGRFDFSDVRGCNLMVNTL
ncbi:MAG: acyl transferase [Bacteroidota bacterium]